MRDVMEDALFVTHMFLRNRKYESVMSARLGN